MIKLYCVLSILVLGATQISCTESYGLRSTTSETASSSLSENNSNNTNAPGPTPSPTPTSTPTPTPTPAPSSAYFELDTAARSEALETLISANQFASLSEALVRSRQLYIPPGTYRLTQTLVIDGWDGGTVLGSGRETTRIIAPAGQSAFRIINSRNVKLGNISIQGDSGLTTNTPIVSVEGGGSQVLNFFNMLLENCSACTALRISSPGSYKIQLLHVTNTGVGVSLENSAADLSILGGNFAFNQIGVRQISGNLRIRTSGMQYQSGADIEIQSAASTGRHLIEAVRTEHSALFYRTPMTNSAVDVAIKATSSRIPGFVDYGGSGVLTLIGNTFSDADSTSINSLVAVKGIGAKVYSVGNILGLSNGTEVPYSVMGSGSIIYSIGDMWEQDAFPHSEIISPSSYASHGKTAPTGVEFRSVGAGALDPRFIKSDVMDVPFNLPRVANLGSLMTSVKSFGAKGDGVTDDTNAVLAAIASLRPDSTGGIAKPLFFPAGIYLIKRPIRLDHWMGGGFFGDPSVGSVIVNSSGSSAFEANGCGYSLFLDMSFRALPGAQRPAFDMNWDNTGGSPNTGSALQANGFFRTEFKGGTSGLAIGMDGYMGSEFLIIDTRLTDATSGVTVGNFNALSVTFVRGIFKNLQSIGGQTPTSGGTFYVYSSIAQQISRQGVDLFSAASNTFFFKDLVFTSSVPFLRTSNSGAPMSLMIEGGHLDPGGFVADYRSGGSVSLIDVDLSGRALSLSGCLGQKTAILAVPNASQINVSNDSCSQGIYAR